MLNTCTFHIVAPGERLEGKLSVYATIFNTEEYDLSTFEELLRLCYIKNENLNFEVTQYNFSTMSFLVEKAEKMFSVRIKECSPNLLKHVLHHGRYRRYRRFLKTAKLFFG